jgi:hypothetical protein
MATTTKTSALSGREQRMRSRIQLLESIVWAVAKEALEKEAHGLPTTLLSLQARIPAKAVKYFKSHPRMAARVEAHIQRLAKKAEEKKR